MKLKTRFKNFNNTFPLIMGIIACIWAIELLNHSMNHVLCMYGIYPRTQIGLRGIIFAPLLHGSIEHLMLNTLPFIVLGSFVASDGRMKFIKVTLFIMLLTGMATWVVAADGFHVGLSGVIFGYFGYLVFIGYYNRNFFSIFIAAVVIFFYGGMIWGIFPSQEPISWEGHLFGLLAGFLAAKFLQ
jgi:membrane associated rhomboid family serine protease